MTDYFRKHFREILVSIISASAFAALFLVIRFSLIFPFNDPDLFFHFRISQLWNESGRPMVLPQYDLIGWNRLFGEKEFLFHALTAAGWRWLQERGVILASLMVSTLSLFQLAYFASRRLGPLWGLLLSSVIVLPTIEFLYRISMVRPQVLGIFFWIWVLFAFFYRSRLAMFCVCVLYALSYHLVAIPLLLLGVFFLAIVFQSKSLKIALKNAEAGVVIWGVLGILAGFVFNPYFPGNLLVSLQVLRIPFLMNSVEKIPFGAELWPKTSNIYFASIVLPMICLGGLIWVRLRGFIFDLNRQVILVLMIALVILKAFNPRAVEYLIPVTVFAAVLLFESFTKKRSKWFIWVFLFLTQFPVLYNSFKEARGTFSRRAELEWAADRRSELKSLKSFPTDSYLRLFHCEWHQSAFWFYGAHVHLKYVDLLDPTFLLVQHPELYRLRQQLVNGQEKDPFLPLASVFGSDLVACGGGRLINQMAADPRFKRISEFENKMVGRVATLDHSRSDHFVKSWMASPWNLISKEELSLGSTQRRVFSKKEPLEAATKESEIEKLRVLFPLYSKSPPLKDEIKPDVDGFFCRELMTDDGWVRKNLGSDLLGWGGGSHVRIWRNGQALFKQEGEAPAESVLQGLIRLSTPIRVDDRFYVMVCARQKTEAWLSLSAWKDTEMREWCQQEDRDLNPSWLRVRGWQSIGGARGNCYALYEP